jgi:hypothetical protein
MAKNVEHLQHVKSNVVVTNNGVSSPKLPAPSVLVEGEIAVNYADGYETLSIKSSSGNIVTFSCDNKFYTKDDIDEQELVVATALNDLEDRKLDASAMTSYSSATEVNTALSGKSDTGHTHDDRYYTKTEVNTALSGKSDTSHTHDDRYYTKTEQDETNLVVSSALNELNEQIGDINTLLAMI